ncbi:Serine/threonine-protein kinase PknD [Planctomycetes bacterium Pan216]|uniref:Serine/threonine-protein kinase PknD n=1 Tax=Kolteria novifilia TaxID=2527975 RepID=A0A518AX46_9BACT|nr:Serine/threonine-protein kinase PknD [Planctomycetes bacterium Pan216]
MLPAIFASRRPATSPDSIGLSYQRLRLLAVGIVIAWTGCSDAQNAGRLEQVWGERGLIPGTFAKPRAIAINDEDELHIVDMRAMIQVFTPEGELLQHWTTPTHELGRPSGLAFNRDGHLLVADSHYHRILEYDPKGELVSVLAGEEGEGPLVGRFGYIGDIATDSQGNLYVAEAIQQERITKLSPEGEILGEWGGRGAAEGQFQRVRALDVDEQDRIYVADACNHRIQVFTPEGELLRVIGEQGSDLGQLYYPYDVSVAPDGTIYVCEYGNHRVQRFSPEGESLGTWGKAGRQPGELWNPWALAVDHQGRVHVVDSNNNRVQRVVF